MYLKLMYAINYVIFFTYLLSEQNLKMVCTKGFGYVRMHCIWKYKVLYNWISLVLFSTFCLFQIMW